MPTYSSALLPTTNGLTLGSSALRWTAYIQDIDVAGTFTAASRLGTKDFNSILFADQFAGATVGDQIDAAVTAAVGGLVVAPPDMGAGFGVIPGLLLDLRSGQFSIYSNGYVTANFALASAGITSGAFISGTSSPAGSGTIRMAAADTLKFRAGILDRTALSFSGTTVIVGGSGGGVQLPGPITFTGALSGITTLSASGQVTSTLATGTAPFSITSTTVVPNLNVATLNGVTVSGTPVSGNSLIATGTTTAGWSTAGIKVESVQYTPVSVNTSNALNDLMTFTLPANELAVGQALRLMASGVVTNTTGGPVTYKFEVRIGTTTILDSGTTSLPTASTSFHYDVEALLICTAAGSSGTLEVQWVGGSMQTAANLASAIPFTGSAATVSFNTTATNVIASSATMGTSSASASITQRQYLLERLG